MKSLLDRVGFFIVLLLYCFIVICLVFLSVLSVSVVFLPQVTQA